MSLHPKIKELQQRAAPITYSSLGVDNKGELVEDNIIKGYAIVWGVVDSYGTKFVKGCCAKSIRERGPESNSKYKITGLWQHDPKDPIAQMRALVEDDYGLYFEMVVDNVPEVPNGMRAVTQVGRGTINQFSFGFNYVWDKTIYDEKDNSIACAEIELYEISPVTRGSNMETYAVRSPEQIAEDSEALRDDTEDFIRTIPRKQQLELRQLITRHISLAKVEPPELRQRALNQNEPVAESAVIDYSYLKNNLNIFDEKD